MKFLTPGAGPGIAGTNPPLVYSLSMHAARFLFVTRPAQRLHIFQARLATVCHLEDVIGFPVRLAAAPLQHVQNLRCVAPESRSATALFTQRSICSRRVTEHARELGCSASTDRTNAFVALPHRLPKKPSVSSDVVLLDTRVAAPITSRWLDCRFAPTAQRLAIFILQTRQILGSQKSLRHLVRTSRYTTTSLLA